MDRPRAVIVHSLDQALAALAPGLPLTLLSAPGAACFAGIAWWQHLIAAAHTAAGAPPADILDCADAPARAAEALRLGCSCVVLSPASPAFASVRSIAEQTGGTLLPARPEAFDMATNRPGPWRDALLAQWLSVHAGSPRDNEWSSQGDNTPKLG